MNFFDHNAVLRRFLQKKKQSKITFIYFAIEGLCLLTIVLFLLFSVLKKYIMSYVSLIIIVVCILIIYIVSYKNYRIYKGVEYSIQLLYDDKDILEEEIKKSKYNKDKKSLVTEHYYIDFNCYNIIKYSEVVSLYTNTSYDSPFPTNFFFMTHTFNNYVVATLKNGIDLRVLNWSTGKNKQEGNEVVEKIVNCCPNAKMDKLLESYKTKAEYDNKKN